MGQPQDDCRAQRPNGSGKSTLCYALAGHPEYTIMAGEVHLDGKNAVCGDEIAIYLTVNDDAVSECHFEGKGCSISIASASMMTESSIGKSLDEVMLVLYDFNQLLRGEACQRCEQYSDAIAFQGVTRFPVRVKCALLAWKTLAGAIPDSGANQT